MESESWTLVGEDGEFDELETPTNHNSTTPHSESDEAKYHKANGSDPDTAGQLNFVDIITDILTDSGSADGLNELQIYGRELYETHYEPLQKQLTEMTVAASNNTRKIIERLRSDANDVLSAIADAFPIIESPSEDNSNLPRK